MCGKAIEAQAPVAFRADLDPKAILADLFGDARQVGP